MGAPKPSSGAGFRNKQILEDEQVMARNNQVNETALADASEAPSVGPNVVAEIANGTAHGTFDQAQLAAIAGVLASRDAVPVPSTELPMTVKDAARFLGVSSQTVYLWVERRRIPHLRVMGRNIRFLKSDLELFRARFRQEVENVTTE
jgi:excisionase family DNA binding protein